MNALSHIPTYIVTVLRNVPVFVWYAAVGFYTLRTLRWVYRKATR